MAIFPSAFYASVRLRVWHRRRIGLKHRKNVSFWIFDYGIPARFRNRGLRAQHATAEALHPFHGTVERFHPDVVHPTARPRYGTVGEPAADRSVSGRRSLDVKVVHARSFFDLPSKKLAVEIGQFGGFLREYLKVSDGCGHGLYLLREAIHHPIEIPRGTHCPFSEPLRAAGF